MIPNRLGITPLKLEALSVTWWFERSQKCKFSVKNDTSAYLLTYYSFLSALIILILSESRTDIVPIQLQPKFNYHCSSAIILWEYITIIWFRKIFWFLVFKSFRIGKIRCFCYENIFLVICDLEIDFHDIS